MFFIAPEINRKIIDHVSDINLAYTEHARRYLISEGMKRDTVYVTGSPMKEVLELNMDKIHSSDVLSTLSVSPQEYFVVSAHREENLDLGENFSALTDSLNAVVRKYQMPIIFSTHPRTQKRIEVAGDELDPLIRCIKPLGFFDYVYLQKNAYCVLSDSGTISEESAMVGFPAVSIRTSTERPEALDAGSIVLGGIRSSEVLNAISIAVNCFQGEFAAEVSDYQDENVSEKVIKLIHSYTEIVNSRTWRKSHSA